MSQAFYHRGLTIEFDSSVPRLAVEGMQVPVKKVDELFVSGELPGVKAKTLFHLAQEVIEHSPEFKKREAIKQTHLAILKQGKEYWNAWRREYPEIRPILYDADLSGVDLSFTDFSNAVLINANLSWAKLIGANFHEANLGRANLFHADLTEANFCRTDLYKTNLADAILHRANLQGTQLAMTNFERAELFNCTIYGLSAWDLNLQGAKQKDLVILYKTENTPDDGERQISQIEESQIIVDDLRVAQFIYLLLHNKNIREAIDTITSKVVLILGRFSLPERKAVLDALREALRTTKPPYVPVLFDFDKPMSRDYIETISTLAHLSRFIIADVTDPKIVLEEVPHIVRNLTIPVQPLLLEGSGKEPVTLYNLRRNHRSLLQTFIYKDTAELIGSLQAKVIAPAEALANELRLL